MDKIGYRDNVTKILLLNGGRHGSEEERKTHKYVEWQNSNSKSSGYIIKCCWEVWIEFHHMLGLMTPGLLNLDLME